MLQPRRCADAAYHTVQYSYRAWEGGRGWTKPKISHGMRRRSIIHLASRASSSKSDLLRGARVLTTPKERANQQNGSSSALQRAAQYQRRRQEEAQDSVDDATARILQQQAARRARSVADPPQAPIYGAGGVTTNSFFDAQFAQMERDGEFSNLKGAGEPLPHRHQSHFGGEDAVDRMLERIMAEQKCIPESLERRKDYLAKYKEFRETLERSVEVQGGSGAPPLKRPRMEAEMAQLRSLLTKFDSASVKDSLTYNMPITKCPKVAATLEEEIAAVRKDRRH